MLLTQCNTLQLFCISHAHRHEGGKVVIVKATPTTGRTGRKNRRRSLDLSREELERIRKANRTSAKRHRDRVRSEVARKACRLTELNAKNAELRQIFMEHGAQLRGLKYAICCQRGWTTSEPSTCEKVLDV